MYYIIFIRYSVSQRRPDKGENRYNAIPTKALYSLGNKQTNGET